MQDEIQRLKAEVAQLRGLLKKHQWAGFTPPGAVGACPECAGTEDRGHRPGCAIAVAVAAAS